jgi:two-component system, NtrC family, response regulator AtoC
MMEGTRDDLLSGAGEDVVTVIPSPAVVASLTAPDQESLSILVLANNFIASYALPDAGEVTIGRSNAVEVYVDDPLVSRRHAILSVGPRPAIRDLGSSNGTRVDGVRLAAGVTRELAVGDVAMVGSATLLLQRCAEPLGPRRFWTRDRFVARLEDTCARPDRIGGRFSIACLQLGRQVPDITVRQILASVLRASDVVGEYGPQAYTVLIADASPEKARAVVERIAAELARRDLAVHRGLAHFPTDGRTAEELIARAQPVAAVRGSQAAISEARVIADPVTQDLFGMADRIATGEISVLIVGETGVGKEVIAEEIYRRSPRAGRPFLRLNCGALSESLLESELFGHERGAFTSAVAAKPGLLETADGGVVLLDEIGEMPMGLQVRLLRVLEDKEVRRVGGVKSQPLDLRFIAATNRDLELDVAHGMFRRDLYYRLAGVTLEIPPLRSRPGDIEPLARAFLAQACRHAARHAMPAISPDALALLRGHSWPGNIRELRNVIERAVLLAGHGVITPAHLPVEKMRAAERRTAPLEASPDDDEPTGPDEGRQSVLSALAACGGNQSRAAKQLGMSRGALIRRLERYGVVRPRKPD